MATSTLPACVDHEANQEELELWHGLQLEGSMVHLIRQAIATMALADLSKEHASFTQQCSRRWPYRYVALLYVYSAHQAWLSAAEDTATTDSVLRSRNASRRDPTAKPTCAASSAPISTERLALSPPAKMLERTPST
jgi:hypothetical protein